MFTRIEKIMIILLFSSPSLLSATVIHVPGDQPTIQAGIDAAVNGDTVLVADGTYTGDDNRNLDFYGKAITVESENGPEYCVIDCEDTGCGFYFNSGETAESRVEGFTITGGAGIYDYAYYRGGGIYCRYSSPTISHCIFTGNTTSFGSGLFCRGGELFITDCTFTGNIASGGAGIAFWEAPGDSLVINCTFLNNTGNAVYITDHYKAMMINCVFSENSAYGGGAVYSDGTLTIINSIFTGNSAQKGAAIQTNASSTADLTLIHCTLTGNIAEDETYTTYGGALYASAEIFITNCILWDNQADFGPEIAIYSGTASVDYSDVEGGSGSVYDMYGLGELIWGTNNIDSNPLFTGGPDGDYYLSQIAAGQAQDSPCTDSGDSAIVGTDGTTRTDEVQDSGTPDMGFHYRMIAADAGGPYIILSGEEILPDASGSFSSNGAITGYRWDWTDDGTWDTDWLSSPTTTTIYDDLFYGYAKLQIKDDQNYTAIDRAKVSMGVLFVDDDNTAGPWDGTLDHPYQYIQDAMDESEEGYTVLIADGTYTGDKNRDLDFKGKAITIQSANGPEDCIIDCENISQGIVFESGEEEDSVVLGLTIRNGGTGYTSGGGISIRNGPQCPTIDGCVIENGSAFLGGGIHSQSDTVPTVINCLIRNNTADLGAGIRCDFSPLNIIHCVITDNHAENVGGGISIMAELESNKARVSHSLIMDNTAVESGGGIMADYADIYNCLIDGNSADAGGGIYLRGGSSTVGNCTIVNNSASINGGGVRCYSDCYPSIKNSILWNNNAPEGPEIWINGYAWQDPETHDWYYYPVELTISYSNVCNGQSSVYVGNTLATLNWGLGMINENPLFISGPRGDYYLLQYDIERSTLISPCVDVGDPASPMLYGTTRTDELPDTGVIDIGFHHLTDIILVDPDKWLQKRVGPAFAGVNH